MSKNLGPAMLPMGDFYPQDEAGHVLNRCSWRKLGDEWRPLVNAVVEAMVSGWEEQLMGVYLRGSVPAGTAVPGFSDLDAFALLKWTPGEDFLRWSEPDWAKEVADALQKTWPIATSVELMTAHHDPQFPGRNPRIKMMIKTQSLCVWGRDLGPEFPAYRPGPDMVVHSRWLADDLRQFREGGLREPSEVRSLMKTLIRTGFELVMEKEGKYATDLYPCTRAFLRHHPEFASAMEAAFDIFLKPEKLESQFPGPLDRLARWLVGQLPIK